jgi:hypothetical protein
MGVGGTFPAPHTGKRNGSKDSKVGSSLWPCLSWKNTMSYPLATPNHYRMVLLLGLPFARHVFRFFVFLPICEEFALS